MSTLHALRSATRFRCLADSCEDTCCAGLKVPVERSAFLALQEALSTNEADRRAFALHVLRDEETVDGYARIHPDSEGRCGFLTQGLCGLHQRFGEPALPRICSTFPRALSVTAGRPVLSLSLACPEAARLCLLAEDGAAVDPADPGLFPRQPQLSPSPSTPLGTALYRAARTVHTLPGISLSGQLLTLAQLAMRTDPEELTALATGESARQVAARFQPLILPWDRVTGLLLGALQQRRGYASQPRFEAWLERLSTRLESAGARTAGETVTLYRERKDALEQTFPVQLERYFRNYALYQWTRFPVEEAPSAVAYLCRLSLRMALLRLLLVLQASDAPSAGALDQLAVETFQLTAKHLEQHPVFRELTDSVLACSEEDRFGKTLLFATFV
ncbi:MAG: flagellin lysine-N-methylase [Myxococcota bacterium]|nr:flagellin lysine-N-methylase [Myxococcota bacterium]